MPHLELCQGWCSCSHTEARAKDKTRDDTGKCAIQHAALHFLPIFISQSLHSSRQNNISSIPQQKINHDNSANASMLASLTAETLSRTRPLLWHPFCSGTSHHLPGVFIWTRDRNCCSVRPYSLPDLSTSLQYKGTPTAKIAHAQENHWRHTSGRKVLLPRSFSRKHVSTDAPDIQQSNHRSCNSKNSWQGPEDLGLHQPPPSSGAYAPFWTDTTQRAGQVPSRSLPGRCDHQNRHKPPPCRAGTEKSAQPSAVTTFSSSSRVADLQRFHSLTLRTFPFSLSSLVRDRKGTGFSCRCWPEDKAHTLSTPRLLQTKKPQLLDQIGTYKCRTTWILSAWPWACSTQAEARLLASLPCEPRELDAPQQLPSKLSQFLREPALEANYRSHEGGDGFPEAEHHACRSTSPQGCSQLGQHHRRCQRSHKTRFPAFWDNKASSGAGRTLLVPVIHSLFLLLLLEKKDGQFIVLFWNPCFWSWQVSSPAFCLASGGPCRQPSSFCQLCHEETEIFWFAESLLCGKIQSKLQSRDVGNTVPTWTEKRDDKLSAKSRGTFPQVTARELSKGLTTWISCLALFRTLFGTYFALIPSCAQGAWMDPQNLQPGQYIQSILILSLQRIWTSCFFPSYMHAKHRNNFHRGMLSIPDTTILTMATEIVLQQSQTAQKSFQILHLYLCLEGRTFCLIAGRKDPPIKFRACQELLVSQRASHTDKKTGGCFLSKIILSGAYEVVYSMQHDICQPRRFVVRVHQPDKKSEVVNAWSSKWFNVIRKLRMADTVRIFHASRTSFQLCFQVNFNRSKRQDIAPRGEKKGVEDREVGALTRQLWAGRRVLVCHTQDTSTWAFSHSSVGRRLHQSTADVHRSPPGTGQTDASSLAVESKSRRSAIKPTQEIARQF